jgi:hypothetical protein
VSAAATNEELTSKLAAFDKFVIWDQDAQNKLHALGDEKKTHELLMESTQKMVAERDYSSTAVISSVVAHAVVLLKSYTLHLDPELLRKDYPFGNDKEQEWDALINCMYDIAQYFTSQYDFSVAND